MTSVLIYHFFGDWLPGGFLGVDVFFVLSGFLITSLLLREFVFHGRISLKSFWKRRLRRIFPLSLTVLVLTTITVGLIGGDLAVQLRSQFFGTLFMVNNWVQIVSGQSYFAESSIQVTAHYWSLAIEEQYYLLWPLIVFGCLWLLRNRLRQRTLLIAVTLAVIVGSITAMALLYTPGEDASRVYYGTDTHAFGLAFGSLLAIWLTAHLPVNDAESFPLRRSPLRRQWLADWVPGLALLGLMVLFVIVDDTSDWTYRGGIALASLFTTIVIAGVVRGNNVVDEWMKISTLRWLGLRSFSIYLWHWPVIKILQALLSAEPVWLPGVLAVGITLVLSELSYRIIENPFRRRGYRAVLLAGPSARRVATAVLALALTAGTTYALVTSPAQSELERDLAELAELQQAPQAAPTPPPAPTETREFPEGSRVTMIGDSVMLAASQSLYDAFPGAYVDGAVSRHYTEGLSILQQMEANGTLGDVVVMGFGTNGPSSGAGDSELLAKVRDTIGPDRLLIYVLPYGDRWYMPEAEAELLDEARTHDNVFIADWCHAARDNWALLREDLVHPTPEGSSAYAQAITDAITQWVDDDKKVPDTCGV